MPSVHHLYRKAAASALKTAKNWKLITGYQGEKGLLDCRWKHKEQLILGIGKVGRVRQTGASGPTGRTEKGRLSEANASTDRLAGLRDGKGQNTQGMMHAGCSPQVEESVEGREMQGSSKFTCHLEVRIQTLPIQGSSTEEAPPLPIASQGGQMLPFSVPWQQGHGMEPRISQLLQLRNLRFKGVMLT